MRVKEPIVSVLSYEEYQAAVAESKILPKYYIVDALQSYIFIHTRNRVIAYDYFKLNYPLYTMRTSRIDKGGGTGCSSTSSTRKGQAKYLNNNYGIPRELQ
jgi:hypothetical protein